MKFTEKLPRLTIPTMPRLPRPAGDTPGKTRHRLNATGALEHLLATPEGVWAWYVLEGVDWPMQSAEHRQQIMQAQTFRWADLIGKRVTLRGVASPYPYQAIADALRDPRNTPRPLPGFDEYVDAASLYALAFGARRDVVTLGVRLSTYPVPRERLRDLLSTTGLPPGNGELDKIRRELAVTTTAMARAGFNGRPMRASGLRWLMHASIGAGAPVPAALLRPGADGWDEDDMPGFTGPVTAVEYPFGATTEVRTLRESREHVNHVAVLHADAFAERDTDRPDLWPFLAWAGTREYPVSYVATFDVLDGRDLKSAAELDRRKAKNIAEHHEEHGDDAPARVLRGIDRARVVEDEVTNGTRETACRLRGTVMFAVSAATSEQACDLASDLTETAAREQGMTLAHDYGQFDYYRAFIPGEPTPLAGHVTQMPGYYAASAVPNATSAAGDPYGMPIGNIAGSHDVYVFDTHGGARRNQSNLVVTAAAPGRGKSTLAGALADHTARRGIRTVVYDPSGPLAALAGMPHLRGHSRHLSLTSAQPGVLVPHLMVVEPARTDYEPGDEGAAAWRAACADADAERMEVCIDAFRDLLPYSMVSGDKTGEVQGVIEQAVTDIGGAYGTNPWQIVDRLKTIGGVGANVAAKLEARALLSDGALVFPPRHRDVDGDAGRRLLEQEVLTVITMEGLSLPPKTQPDRALWSRQQQASVPILNLGARFATKVIYSDRDPKAIFLDEMGIATGGAGSFSSAAIRYSFDSRKWNALINIMVQNPNTLTGMDDQISNLTGAAFIGQMDEDAALAAMPFLRLKPDSGYHHAVETLETGEFVVRGWDGRVRKVRLDRDWWDDALVAALNTNPYGDDAEHLAGLATLGGML